MAAISRQDASGYAGKQITFQAATGVTGSGTDTLTGGQCVHLLVNNASGGARTLTLVTPETVEGSLLVGDRTVSIPAGTIWEVPVPSRYNDPTSGVASISVDATASVTYAAVQGTATP